MEISSRKAATVDSQRLRWRVRIVLVNLPFLEVSCALPNGSLHNACTVSLPRKRAAAFDGASFCTVSEPAKYVIKASVTLRTAVFPVPPGPMSARI